MIAEIKEYSSKFATKMNYILDIINVAPLQHGRTKAISSITHEKDTTINNWLFNGKYPRENKKLVIADAIGVSHNYLFDDNIEINNIIKPEICLSEGCYLIPFIQENNIFHLKNNKIFSITSRLPIMFPSFDEFVKKYGTHIYITRINNCNFESHIQPNSDIIYSENVILENFRFIIQNNHKKERLIVKRIIQEGEHFFCEFFDDKKKLIKEIINPNTTNDCVSLVLTFSKTF